MLDLSNAVRYHYDEFPPDRIDYSVIIKQLLDATGALARYDQMLKNMHNNEILLAPLRNQEAVISSRMEGTISTIDEIMEFEANAEGNEDAENKNVRSEVVETILYQRALKNAQKGMEDGYDFSTSFIKTIHRQLLSFGRGASKAPGEFKREQNYLAGKSKNDIRFIPVSPEKLVDGMEILFNYLENSSDPELIKTALMHVEFEALHPFQDGNGRIGRMMITLLLWRRGVISAPHFYISGYLEENKDEYIERMRAVSEKADWEGWCAFFLKAIEAQAINNLQIAESIRNLYEDMKIQFSEILSSKWSMQALDFIFTNPVFRNNKFTSGNIIPGPTAAKFAKKLLDNDLLKEKEPAAGRKAALYSFEPLMKLVRV